jgi:hypothetical protein
MGKALGFLAPWRKRCGVAAGMHFRRAVEELSFGGTDRLR